MISAFWLGGMVATLLFLWAELVRAGGVKNLPEPLLMHPAAFGLLVFAMVLIWPGGCAFVLWCEQWQKEQRKAEQAEWERIEATRAPAPCPLCEQPGADCWIHNPPP